MAPPKSTKQNLHEHSSADAKQDSAHGIGEEGIGWPAEHILKQAQKHANGCRVTDEKEHKASWMKIGRHKSFGGCECGLTNPSSATGTGEARLDYKKRRNAGACSLERVVRSAPTERTNGNTPPTGGGMRVLPLGKDERRKRRTGTGDVLTGANGNTLDCDRTGIRVPLANREQRTQGLTPPSSATGRAKTSAEEQTRPHRPACSLERVVRGRHPAAVTPGGQKAAWDRPPGPKERLLWSKEVLQGPKEPLQRPKQRRQRPKQRSPGPKERLRSPKERFLWPKE